MQLGAVVESQGLFVCEWKNNSIQESRPGTKWMTCRNADAACLHLFVGAAPVGVAGEEQLAVDEVPAVAQHEATLVSRARIHCMRGGPKCTGTQTCTTAARKHLW